eukprot:COSAG01_NODE_16555_length_1226_cov_6.269743_2_plen_133_part_00
MASPAYYLLLLLSLSLTARGTVHINSPEPQLPLSSSSSSCCFGDAHPPVVSSSGGGNSGSSNSTRTGLSCAPPARVGVVNIIVDVNQSEAPGRYLQASVLSFTNPSPMVAAAARPRWGHEAGAALGPCLGSR